MRIQHNIMAMGAYRNYTNNLSAMKKNLEKLSSGYKINRAGDDAAGLAISEKMRAQITGLETAQKNAKDGISLVQTAEGALTEVHDMLNRMVELATQSANGTYDNETDRYQLQKEMDQLRSEINRIADSSNFNGIKLLDGSMDGTPIAGELTNVKAAAAGAADPALPLVGQILGTDTVLHKGSTNATTAQFGISLHEVTYSNDDANGQIKIKFGDDEITLSGGATKAVLDTGDLVSAMTSAAQKDAAGNAGTGTNARDMEILNQKYVVEGDTLEEQLTSWANQFNADSTASSNGQIIAAVKGSTIEFTAATAGTAGNALTVGTSNLSGGVDGVKQKNTGTVAVTGIAAGDSFTIGGTTYDVVADDAAVSSYTGPNTAIKAADVTAAWATQKLVDAGAFEIAGFNSPDYTSGATFTIEAVETGAPTATNHLGASDVSTDLSSVLSGDAAVTAKFAVTYAQTTAGVDEVKATLNSGAVSRLTPSLEIGDGKYSVSSTDPKAQLEEFMKQYNADKTKKYTAEWNDNGNGIKFTAKTAGESGLGANPVLGTDDTTTSTTGELKFKAGNGSTAGGTSTDGTDSTLGTNKVMDAKAILKAIMEGKAELNGDALTVDQLVNGVTLSDGATYKITAEGDTLTFTQIENDTQADGTANTAVLDRVVTVSGDPHSVTQEPTVQGDYQKSTTFNTPDDAGGGNRLASTWFTMTADKVVDGGAIFIGGKNYQFTTDEAAAKADATKVYIGDLLDEDTGKMSDDTDKLIKLNERITVAAKDNEVYTVGYDQGRLTFTERVGYTTGSQEYDLTKLSEIERSLGFTGAEKPSDGKSLKLQIGDTADDFNQLSVNIKDMHTEAMGIGDISIADQESAAAAVDKIKAAINYVSDVRGTLGATQNRLDHTINNLSVMTENIQDAESTIRDTDVAEEMMAYTKNNILIQSAQAMLAQANQVPQGVLQLLQ